MGFGGDLSGAKGLPMSPEVVAYKREFELKEVDLSTKLADAIAELKKYKPENEAEVAAIAIEAAKERILAATDSIANDDSRGRDLKRTEDLKADTVAQAEAKAFGLVQAAKNAHAEEMREVHQEVKDLKDEVASLKEELAETESDGLATEEKLSRIEEKLCSAQSEAKAAKAEMAFTKAEAELTKAELEAGRAGSFLGVSLASSAAFVKLEEELSATKATLEAALKTATANVESLTTTKRELEAKERAAQAGLAHLDELEGRSHDLEQDLAEKMEELAKKTEKFKTTMADRDEQDERTSRKHMVAIRELEDELVMAKERHHQSQKEHESLTESVRKEHKSALKAMKKEHASELRTSQHEHEAHVDDLTAKHTQHVDELTMKHTKEVGGLMQEHGRQAAIAADSIAGLQATVEELKAQALARGAALAEERSKAAADAADAAAAAEAAEADISELREGLNESIRTYIAEQTQHQDDVERMEAAHVSSTKSAGAMFFGMALTNWGRRRCKQLFISWHRRATAMAWSEKVRRIQVKWDEQCQMIREDADEREDVLRLQLGESEERIEVLEKARKDLETGLIEIAKTRTTYNKSSALDDLNRTQRVRRGNRAGRALRESSGGGVGGKPEINERYRYGND